MDIKPLDLKWNPKDGGAYIKYRVTATLMDDEDLKLFFATGDNENGDAIYTDSVRAGTTQGIYEVYVPADSFTFNMDSSNLLLGAGSNSLVVPDVAIAVTGNAKAKEALGYTLL